MAQLAAPPGAPAVSLVAAVFGVALSLAACSSSETSGGEGGPGTLGGGGGNTTSTSSSSGAGGAGSSSSTSSSSTSSSSTSSSSTSSSSTTSSSTSTTTSSSSSSSTSSSGAPSDPCAGAPDGAHCGTDLGGMADHTSVYQCQGSATASAMGCAAGCQNGACNQPPADPCANANSGNGAYCGASLGAGNPGTLYDCQNKSTASSKVCAAGCQVNPPGVADVCKPTGDPCSGANSGNGAYCGISLAAGNPDTLYDCQNKVTASSTVCAAGCQVNPPGMADACKSNGGQCCLNHPPGVVTQPFTACGNGGSHYGIDYGTPVGTPIYAGIAGTIVGSALGFPNCYNNGCSGACWNSFNYVKVKSDCGDPQNGSNDLFVYYLHIDSLAAGIANGSHVDQGQLVAYSGNSGCSSGPHIHLETASVPKGSSAVLNTCSSVNPSSRYCPGQ